MFSELTGVIKKINQDSITLLINNVGYLVNLSENVLEKLHTNNEQTFLIETRFKVDKIVLFGFLNDFQQFFFNKISNISGVSDKIALSLSGFFEPHEIIHILNSNNKDNPFKINGLGSKTWEKIIFNLERDKNFIKECSTFNNHTDSTQSSINITIQNHKNEAISALINIGITKNIATDLIEKSLKEKNIENITTEDIVKFALALHYQKN